MEQEERNDNPNGKQGSNKFGLRDSDNAKAQDIDTSQQPDNSCDD